MNLRDYAIGNIEEVLSKFVDYKMTKKERAQLAADMAVIASNAYRIGYYAATKIYTDVETTDVVFDDCEKGSDTMSDILRRFTEAAR